MKADDVMPLDASAVKCAAYEINNLIAGGRVEKIYQPEKDEIVLLIKSAKENMRLVISANSQNSRLYITNEAKENPQSPPMFCMLLRKHIASGKILSVKSVDFERIAEILIESRNELGDTVNKRIICEIMGKNSNIILVDEKGKIIDSVKHVDLTVSRVRNIFPGLTYTLPPDGDRLNPLNLSQDEFLSVLSDAPEGKNIDKALTSALSGISPLMAREACYKALGAGNKVMGEMTAEDKKKVSLVLYNMFQRIKNNDFESVVLYKKGDKNPVDFAVYPVEQYGEGYETKKTEGICRAMEIFYSEKDSAERMRQRSYALLKNINQKLERVQKKIALLHTTLTDSEEREKYRIAGDIITANLHRINRGDKALTAINYYDEEQKEITIALDESKSPSKNAQMYYKKYAKAKTAETEAKKQLEIAMEDLEYLESVIANIEMAKTPSELEEIRTELIDQHILPKTQTKKKAKANKVSAPEEYEYMGYTIYSGKNNLQNDYLTLKMGRANDLWLHTKNIPGSHVLVKSKGEEFPDKVIEAAAKIAAVNSKGKNAPKTDVDYCVVSHVKKPNGAKAGMVIYEGYYTVTIVPDEDFVNSIKIKKNN